MKELAEILKVLADMNRLRILALLEEQPLCVCDIEEALQLNQSNLSRHLARLKDAALVESQKRGLFMYYSSAAPREGNTQFVTGIVELARCSESFTEDLERLGACKCSKSL